MKIGILGTGMVGRAFAVRLHELGFEVVIGTRNVSDTLAKSLPDSKGTPPYSEWAKTHPNVELVTFTEAVTFGDLLVNATAGAQTLNMLHSVDSTTLVGKTLIDLALPLSYSQGQLPHLAFANDDSLGEQVQRAFPATSVVKTLNTMSMAVMLNPSLLPPGHNVFLSGDDSNAKSSVMSFLSALGWPNEAMIDLGGISTARGTEMYANLLFMIAKSRGVHDFNIGIFKAI